MIDKVVASGNALLKAQHFAKDDIGNKKKELEDAWKGLLSASARRKDALDLNLRKQMVRMIHASSTHLKTVFNDVSVLVVHVRGC